MSQEYIQFKKQRELGEILSITFKFLRENYKSAGKIFLRLVGPVFILLIAAITYYSWSTIGLSFLSPDSNATVNFIIPLGVLMLAYLLYISAMTGTIYHIIQSYINNGGEILGAEVSSGMRNDFGKLLLLTFISWIFIFAGTMLFIIPGVYLLVPMSLVTAILVFRRKGIGDSISESFELIKDNWWMTFASILCIGLIVYVIGIVFQLPAILYYIVRTFTIAQEGSASDPSEILGVGFVVVNVITSTIQYLVYSITPIAIAFVYFNLNEKQHFTGTYETIQNLGNNNKS